MANPLSDQGYSDEDFAAAVGIAMGETGSKRINRDEMAAVVDVARNRLDRYDQNPNHYRAEERSLRGIIEARGQFDASNKRGSKGGRQQYNAAQNAILHDVPVPANMRARYNAAVEEVINVATGVKSGIARGADYFSSTGKKLSRAKQAEHNKLGKKGGTKIGASTFYGPKTGAGPHYSPTKGYYAGGQQYGPAVPAAPPDRSMGRYYDAPIGAAPYSPSNLNFGPDFSSPPSQARGGVENPYGFSNINTAVEAAPGSFAGYGPNAFGALDDTPVDYGQTYPDISAGLYDQAAAPMSNEDFNAIFSDVPESESTGGIRGGAARPSYDPYGFSGMQAAAPAPNAATIPNDVTGYGAGGAFSSRAPSTEFDFESIVNDSFGPYSGGYADAAGPTAPRQEAAVDYGQTYPDISAGMYEGPEMSPFQGTQLGLGQGLIDQGPYSSPIGGLGTSFSPATLGNPMPASREIIGYEPGKTITRDVPNPAWSDWSREYGTKNALQDAWLAADEDKFGRDTIRSSFVSRPIPDEPARTIQRERTLPATPIYSPAVPAIQAQPTRIAQASVPAVQAQPLAKTVSAPAAAPVGVGGWWDSFTNGLGNMLGGMSLSGLGGNYSGYGNFGGGYDPGGYGGGGYGGTSPGDAGYGSDARSGTGNMGAGNLYS
jgi:hypothetical protein